MRLCQFTCDFSNREDYISNNVWHPMENLYGSQTNLDQREISAGVKTSLLSGSYFTWNVL